MRARYFLLPLSLAACGGNPAPAAAPAAEAATLDSTSTALPRITPESQRRIANMMRSAYPQLLFDAGVGGQVRARFVVLANGMVDERTIRIVESENVDFGRRSSDVLAELRFAPALRDGVPEPAWLEATLEWIPQAGRSNIRFSAPVRAQ